MTLNIKTWLILLGILIVFESMREYQKAKNKRSYLIKELGVGIPVILALFLFGPLILLSPVKIGFDQLRTDKVVVFYPKNKIDIGRDLAATTSRAVANNEKFYRVLVNTQVLMAATKLDMFRLTGNLMAGGAGTEMGVIVRYDRVNEGIITHELSHIMLPKVTARAGYFFPRWWDEGLASYLGKMDYYDKLPELKRDLKEGRYVRDLDRWNGLIGKINWLMDVRTRPGIIYGQTFQMMKFLFDKYGAEKVYQLVLACKTQSFEAAFEQTFSQSVSEWHQEFIRLVESS